MSAKRKTSPVLTSEQEWFINCALNGYPVTLTGGAGTGKSFAIKEFHEQAQARYHKDAVLVCTPTNKSATNLSDKGIAASTIHSLFGIKVKHSHAPDGKSVREDPIRTERFKKAIFLVIDEIWMVSTALWKAMDDAARKIRGTMLVQRIHAPDATEEEKKITGHMFARDTWFGGLVVVCCGDPLQLPPVSTLKEMDLTTPCILSDEWQNYMYERGGRQMLFENTMRQREGDPLLTQLKYIEEHGTVSAKFLEMLNSVRIDDDLLIPPTALVITPTNVVREEYNNLAYSLILAANPEAEAQWPTFTSRTIPPPPPFGSEYEYKYKMNADRLRTPEELSILPGSMVIVSRNTLGGIERMTRGRVDSWRREKDGTPTVRIWVDTPLGEKLVDINTEKEDLYDVNDSGNIVMTRIGLPLIPGHACTVYGCQGITATNIIVIDLGSRPQLTKYRITTSDIYTAASRAERWELVRTIGRLNEGSYIPAIPESRMEWLRTLRGEYAKAKARKAEKTAKAAEECAKRQKQ